MKLSLRWKIVGGFGLLLTLIALLGWVTLSLFSSLRDVQRRVFDEAIPGLVAVDEIVRSYTAQSAAVRGALITSSSLQPLVERYRIEVATANHYQERARELFRSGEERELLDRLVQAGEEFQRLVDEEVLPRATAGNRSQAFSILDSEGTDLITEIELQGDLLLRTQEDRVIESENVVASSTRQAIIILLIVILGALAIGMFLAIVLPQRLVKNLARLVEAARAIGRGDLNHQVDIRSGDEVEELSARFGEMQAGLKRLQQLALQDRELEIAGTIQRNLLQRTLPEIPGVSVLPLQRQANLVGGDWYDVNVSRQELTIAVGDASGKGIAAALMATVALSFLRAERALGSSPKRIIERTNEALLDATDPDSFTTLVYLSLDLHTGTVRWLNMGHPAPFLLRAAGDGGGAQGFYLEGPRNRALGWFDEPGLSEAVASIVPGDSLLLFTDGWLEAKSAEGEVFGETRFAETVTRLAPLGAEALAEELVVEVERFAAGKLDDDLTMLIVEFEGAPRISTGPQRQTEEQTWHSRR